MDVAKAVTVTEPASKAVKFPELSIVSIDSSLDDHATIPESSAVVDELPSL
ncbi:hypothetical protein JCM18904_3246 [Vibrio sp. JCM 18904]|nr:hypothetical protein JCM18904_3246 [Vibrio sp. JCM 18904]